MTLMHCDSSRPAMLQRVTAATLEEKKKSWKYICEVDASLASELYEDKNIFVPVEVKVRVGGGAGCAWMKGGCEMIGGRLRVSGLCRGEACKERRHFEERCQ